MRVALAEVCPRPGDLASNLDLHLDVLAQAAALQAQLVVFPELSLTGYEPTLARRLQRGPDCSELRTLQGAAQGYGQRVCVGLPTPGRERPRISMAVLGGPDTLWVHKHVLHADEQPFFEAGPAAGPLSIHGRSVGFVICYELTQDSRVQALVDGGAQLLVASVAKTEAGMAAASLRLADLAERHRLPALAVNAVGPADGVVCGGGSGVFGECAGLKVTVLSGHRRGPERG